MELEHFIKGDILKQPAPTFQSYFTLNIVWPEVSSNKQFKNYINILISTSKVMTTLLMKKYKIDYFNAYIYQECY